MTRRPGVDVSRLPVLATGAQAPLWWGMILLVTIETVVFGAFASSYFYLRFGAPQWPPAGIEPPDLFLPTVNTLVLVASGVAMHWADRGMDAGNVRRLQVGMAVATSLSAVFLVLKAVEYSGVDYRWDTNAYGSIVWAIIGFHSAHVASVLLKGVVVSVLAFRGHFTRERRLGVQVNGIYWQFVVLIWLPLYVLLYWVPRL